MNGNELLVGRLSRSTIYSLPLCRTTKLRVIELSVYYSR